VFELTLKSMTSAAVTSSDEEAGGGVASKRSSSVAGALTLRGQMMLVGEWDLIVFLCTPLYEYFDVI